MLGYNINKQEIPHCRFAPTAGGGGGNKHKHIENFYYWAMFVFDPDYIGLVNLIYQVNANNKLKLKMNLP